MPFNKTLSLTIENYCKRDLPSSEWYNTNFDFIKDSTLKERIIIEFNNARFIYKFFEGLSAKDELLLAQVRLQILMYASIYEAIIHYILFDEAYYKNTPLVNGLLTQKVNKPISIPSKQQILLEKELVHNSQKIIPYFETTQKRDITKVRFDEKCITAFDLGILTAIDNQATSDSPIITLNDCPNGKPLFCGELIKIYEFRNAIHLHAEIKKEIHYQLELSRIAYRRLQPFVEQIKNKLHADSLF